MWGIFLRSGQSRLGCLNLSKLEGGEGRLMVNPLLGGGMGVIIAEAVL